MEKQNKNYVLPIVVMFLLYFMIAFVTNFAGSMGSIVKNQFGVSNALALLGLAVNFIAYAFMGIPAGMILKRKGYKFTSLAAVLVGLVGVAIQWISGPAASFAVYILGAFVAGFSMCMLNVVVNPMLNTLGGGGNRGNQLNLFGGAFNSIGGTLAPILLGYLLGGIAIEKATVPDAAPAMIAAMAIFAVAFLVIFFTNIPEPHMETAEEKAARLAGNQTKDAHSPLSFRHFILGAIAIFFYVGAEVGIPFVGKLYMEAPVENGGVALAPTLAGALVGAYWFLMMCGRFIGGAIGGKVSSKLMLSTVAFVALCLISGIMFIPESSTINLNWEAISMVGAVPVKMICMVLCGLCTSVMWGCIFNLSTEGLGKYVPMASGLFMVMVCGGALSFVQGALADSIGYLGSYILVMISFLYILFFALIGSKNVNKDIPVE
ncbi:MAG: MFS transporter [Paludibacteraceae bacterium]|nr:MFS transporter [Paludibacteraceae bacterium]